MNPQKRPNEKQQLLKNIASFSGVAIQMGATIYLGNLFGEWVDGKFNTSYWEEIITLLAVFMAMGLVIKKAISMGK
ncbi:AtpZ/AtpI family protein [Croceivirga sp. JEA036]|uniref:AtpZ/AtpI family protein n=1 Tax=Croceivirga sp. JEA036 TaxID=2721162 RepID=UPI00143A30FC|nr:AtpZ/AtpI family protein [Croceivirga sp. JEA036]NJB37104.1 AtpZ/AtpI family protein [Croceivirga sp. JEA036]